MEGPSPAGDLEMRFVERAGASTHRPLIAYASSTIAISIALWMCATCFYMNWTYFHDDAYITLRYAHNLIHGDGVVWNPGERVEGYTNFLHLLVESGLGVSGMDLRVAAQASSGAWFVLLVTFAGVFMTRSLLVGSQQPGALVVAPLILIVTCHPLIVWVRGGLEPALSTLLCTVGVWSFAESRQRSNPDPHRTVSAIAFALCAMARMDTLIFVVVAFGFLLRASPSSAESLVRRTVRFGLPFLAVYLPFFVWRMVYYGDLLPITGQLKLAGFVMDRLAGGLNYVGSYSVLAPYLFVLFVAGVAWAGLCRVFDWTLAYLVASVTTYVAYVVWAGGDHMHAYRLLIPVLPTCVLVVFLSYIRIVRTRSTGLVVAGQVLALALSAPAALDNLGREDTASFVGTVVGKYIATAWPPGSLVALNTAGSTPFYAPNHRYVDMLGLNDARIAKRKIEATRAAWQWLPGHMKGDGAYVLSREPDFIIVGPAHGTTIEKGAGWFLSDAEMNDDPRFRRHYKVDYALLEVVPPAGFAGMFPDGKLVFTFYRRVE